MGAALLGVALGGGVAAVDGGFFPESWSWIAVASLFAATVLLLARPLSSMRLLDHVLLGGLALFGAWVAISAIWSTTVTGAIEDSWRVLAYVGAVGLTLLVVERRSVPHLLGGTLLGVTAIGGYALLTRLLPDRLGDFQGLSTLRLADPIGYWNGLGVYCAMGILLALGFAARGERVAGRVLAAAVPVVLITAMYLTFSRGAWLALGAGLAAAVLLDPQRLQLVLTALALAPWSVLAVVAASRADALSTEGSRLADATHDGHRLLLVTAVLVACSALAGLGLALAGRRVEAGRGLRAAFAGLLVAAAVAAAAAVWVEHGSPWSLADRGWKQFTSGPKSSENLSGRLFDLSSNGRIELWGVSWHDFEARPVLGRGAGSFEQSFYEHRHSRSSARDGHSLYAETLGEMGLVGLALLALGLLAPLAAAVRARGRPLVPAVLGAYAAYLVHASVDWDWELAGVTLVALLAAGALVVSARDDAPPRELPRLLRVAGPGAAALLAALALWSLLATVPEGRARTALESGQFGKAIRYAGDARKWAPWSSRPWRMRGEAQLAQGDLRAARASLEEAVRREPGEWVTWLELALASDGAEKRRALARAAALNPNEGQVKVVQDSL